MESVGGLHLVQGDDDILEEDHVLFSKGDGEARDDGCQDVEEFSGTIEFIVFVDQGVEAVCDGFSDHLSSWDQLGVESV